MPTHQLTPETNFASEAWRTPRLRSSFDDILAAANFNETLSRHFRLLYEQFEADARAHSELQHRFHELEMLHNNCMLAAKSGDIPSSGFTTILPRDVKEIHALRQRAIDFDNAKVLERIAKDQADSAQKKFHNLSDSLTKALARKGFLPTRRAIARILKRHNKANP